MKLSLVTAAVIILVSPALWSWNAAADSDHSVTGAGLAHFRSVGGEEILFRRGFLNTLARQDLDSAQSDATSVGKGETGQGDAGATVRIVQFYDHIKPQWLKKLKGLGC